MTDERRPIRIGTAERDAAMKALDVHLEEGRLDVDEYGERSAKASVATTAPELAVLFEDLPAPHPPLPGVPGLPAVTAPPAAPVPSGPSSMEVWGPRLVALSPFIAVALFLLTRQWIFFLLIPVAGMVFGSSHKHGGHGKRRNR